MKSKRILSAIGLFCLTVSGFGCTAIETVFHKYEHQQDLSEIRRDTREELADIRKEQAEQETDRKRTEAEIEALRSRYEGEFCQANQEALKQRVKSNIKETVESKLAFNFSQNLEVGELEVDEAALKKVLELREKERLTTPPRAPFRGKCGCDDRPCGCDGGLVKRHCLRCRHKQCGCKPEPDCGGPEAFRQLAREPLRKPLRPTEIPLKLPVRISFGMGNPDVEETRIRREPFRDDREPSREPCDGKTCPCDACRYKTTLNGGYGPPKDVSKLLTAKRDTAEENELSDPPKPIPDEQ